MSEATNIHAEVRTDEICARLESMLREFADGIAGGAMMRFMHNAPDDIAWLIKENERLRVALLIYTRVRH